MREDLLLLRGGKSVKRAQAIERRLTRLTRLLILIGLLSLAGVAAFAYQKHVTRRDVANQAVLQTIGGEIAAYFSLGFPRTSFIDFYTLTRPYLPTNNSFFLCPVDKGPWNYIEGSQVGLKTNDLPALSSYLFCAGLHTRIQGRSWNPLQRFTREVTYPAQKVSLECLAINGKKDIYNGSFVSSTVHAEPAKPGGNIALVDGHSRFVHWDYAELNLDPGTTSAGVGWDWSDATWADLK